jgi:hypothetical protein
MTEPRDGQPYVTLTQASTIPPRPVKWLCEGRIPLGALSLVGGREGIGKSSVLYTCAADITRGRLRGEYFETPRNVIVAATEDSWEHTIVPRLIVADADLERVYRVDGHMADGVQGGLCLPRDIPALEDQARDVRAVWTLLDPLTSRLDGKLNQNYDGETRRALEPLSAIADVTRMAMTGIIHVNKGQHEDVLSTIMGSRAFVAVARTVLIVMVDPDDDTIRLVGLAKNNLGPVSTVPTLKYTVENAYVCETSDGPVWTGKVQWHGESTQTIREAFATTVDTSGDKTALSEACDWLVDYLTAARIAVESATVRKPAKRLGTRLMP